MKNRQFQKSSGNVFKDLELPDYELEDTKAKLALRIFQIIEHKKNEALLKNGEKLTQEKLGKMLGIKQPEMSKLSKGQYARFSLERLLYFVRRLHYSYSISIFSDDDEIYPEITASNKQGAPNQTKSPRGCL